MSRDVSGILVVFALTLTQPACAAATEPSSSSGAAAKAVARYGDRQVTAGELEEALGNSTFRIRQQLYDAEAEGLRKLVFDRLVAEAAATAGKSAGEYLEAEIARRAGAPTDEEIDATLEQYRARLAKDDAQARQQVIGFLTSQARQKAESELRDELFAANNVTILLEPPRVEPSLEGAHPSRGDAQAPVTLIEYTDFQCPFCRRVQPTLDELVARYDGRLRHVFKQLPLAMHAQAQLAAEASLCADDQGKFWELHDWLFANQSSISKEAILGQTEALGIDGEVLASCLEEHRHAADIKTDQEEARRFAISGTPGFMINGRFISGAQPFEAFASVIDDELRRAGVPAGPSAAAPATEEPATAGAANES